MRTPCRLGMLRSLDDGRPIVQSCVCGVEQRYVVGLITRGSQVQILPLATEEARLSPRELRLFLWWLQARESRPIGLAYETRPPSPAALRSPRRESNTRNRRS